MCDNPVEFGWVELETASKDVVFSCRSRRGHHFSVTGIGHCCVRCSLIIPSID